MNEWRRDPTPPKGNKRVVRVLQVGFATDLLSTALALPKRKPIWVKPAASGGTTVIDLMFTRDVEADLAESLAGEPPHLEHTLIAYQPLSNGEAFCITSWHSDKAGTPMRVPASHGHKRDLIILPKDPEATGRPVRFSLFSKPKDGEFMRVWESGAYWHSPLTDAEWKAMQQE